MAESSGHRRPASKVQEPVRMSGFVASHVPDRHFGFIKGDDRKSYFFHFSDGQAKLFSDGSRVSFIPSASPKGYRAEKVFFEKAKQEERWILLKSPMFREVRAGQPDLPAGFEVIAETDLFVRGALKSDIQQLKKLLLEAVDAVGGNAVIGARVWRRSETEDGHLYFTRFYIYGRAALVGRKSSKGQALDRQKLTENMRSKMVKLNAYIKEKADANCDATMGGATVAGIALTALCASVIPLAIPLVAAVAGARAGWGPMLPFVERMPEDEDDLLGPQAPLS